MFEVIQDNWLLFLIGSYPYGPLGGLVATGILALVSVILSFVLAMLLALGRINPYRPINYVATMVVQIMRGTPFLMVIFWSYFALPKMIGVTIDGFYTLIGALVVYESAYMAEVIRSGINALPKGQMEAARSLGLGYWRTMFYVVLPQALFNAMPNMLTQFVSTIKETSLGYVIGVNEFTFAATQVNNQLLDKPVEVFSILALTYFVLCFALTQTARFFERYINNKRNRHHRLPDVPLSSDETVKAST